MRPSTYLEPSLRDLILPLFDDQLSMNPASFYHHCPRCGVRQLAPPTGHVFNCPGCGFRLYFSAAGAVAVFIGRPDGRMLFIIRGKDPGRGKLAPPGGFIDLGETAEVAAQREVREEVGLELQDLRFLCSQPNSYLYCGVTYPVLDLFFTATVAADTEAIPLDAVTAVRWLDPGSLDPEELAFTSMQKAFRRLITG